MIYPGSILGMLGGGQLGRMFALAAAQMGYQVWVIDPNEHSPAGEVAARHIRAEYEDLDALKDLGTHCEVVTTEFENVPAITFEHLQDFDCVVHPNSNAVHIAQNRIREKQFVNNLGVPTAPFIVVNTLQDLDAADELQWPSILKTARFGYDGKGQQVVKNINEARQAFQDLEQVPCILEERIQLDKEISVVLGRNEQGEICFFPCAENEHKNGILHISCVPAEVSEEIQTYACEIAQQIAEKLQYVGILAIEFFIDEQQNLLVNELAPRVHNSGHYTLDACHISQFEQQVRMICGWPPADTRNHSAVAMVNILGDTWQQAFLASEVLLENINVHLHLYGKQGARPGRKMGHFNVLAEDVQTARSMAESVYQQLMKPFQ